MQLFPNIETAVVTEGFLIMMTAETGDSTPLDVFIIVMAVLVSVPPLWILRQYQGR